MEQGISCIAKAKEAKKGFEVNIVTKQAIYAIQDDFMKGHSYYLASHVVARTAYLSELIGDVSRDRLIDGRFLFTRGEDKIAVFYEIGKWLLGRFSYQIDRLRIASTAPDSYCLSTWDEWYDFVQINEKFKKLKKIVR